MTATDADDWAPPKRSKLPLLILTLAVLGGGGAAAWFLVLAPTPTDPTRVLVSVTTTDLEGATGTYWGARGKASAAVADAVGAELEALGLATVSGGSAETLAALGTVAPGDEAGLRATAAALGAGWVVHAEVTATDAVTLGDGPDLDVGLDVAWAVWPSDAKGAALDVPGGRYRTHAVGDDAEGATVEAAEWVAELATSRLATALATSKTLARLEGSGSELTRDEMKLASGLNDLFALSERRARYLGERDQDAKEWAMAIAAEGAKARDALGEPLDEEYAVGPLPSGELLMLLDPRHVEVLRKGAGYVTRETHEMLVAQAADGTRRTVLEVYNVFSYPNVAPTGLAAAVLDHRQRAKALVVFDTKANATGSFRTLTSSPDGYFSTPTLSDDGAEVAFWSRDCRRCPSTLEVMATDGSGQRKALLKPSQDQSSSVPSWSPDGKTLYLSVFPTGGKASVVAIDVATGEQTPVRGPLELAAREDRGEEIGEGDSPDEGVDPWLVGYENPRATPDGTSLIVREEDDEGAWHLGRVTLADGAYERLWSGPCKRLEVSPDGRWLAFETWRTVAGDDPYTRDAEVAALRLVPGDGPAFLQLSKNTLDDDLIGWGVGQTVLHHQSARDAVGRGWTNRAYATPLSAE